jgi:hypothetical protein
MNNIFNHHEFDLFNKGAIVQHQKNVNAFIAAAA